MLDNNIDEIIRLVLTGEATSEEMALLQLWLAKSKENQEVFHQLQLIWDERAQETELINANQLSEDLWRKGVEEEKVTYSKRQSNYLYPYYAKIAAVVLLVLSMTLGFYIYKNATVPSNTVVKMIEKKNPIGRKLKVQLPDGSLVWLNAESKIRYAEKFSGPQRSIELDGEAYFEVKKDKHKPFVVTSGKVSTTAIGTSFNIAAYPEDSTVQVALLTGKVKVNANGQQQKQDAFLKQGEGIDFHKTTFQSRRYSIDEAKVLAWKQGVLMFEGDSFEEVQQKLRRWYGLHISISGTPPSDWKLTGKFTNEHLRAVLENIRFARNFTYTLRGDQLIFHFDKPKS